MSATVAQMPARPSPLAEQEAKLVGAALHLGPPTPVLAALGLIAADFSVELHAKAWGAVLRQSEAGIRVTWETVTSAGLQRETTDRCGNLGWAMDGAWSIHGDHGDEVTP